MIRDNEAVCYSHLRFYANPLVYLNGHLLIWIFYALDRIMRRTANRQVTETRISHLPRIILYIDAQKRTVVKYLSQPAAIFWKTTKGCAVELHTSNNNTENE